MELRTKTTQTSSTFFASIGYQVSVSGHLKKSFQLFFPRNQWFMYLYKTTARELGENLNNLDNKSFSSDDDRNNRLIKLFSDVIKPT